LVDAGNNGDGDEVAAFIADAGVERLAYAIGTHPHEDHIGGLDQVLDRVPTDAVILPDKESDTQTYQDVLAAIENSGAERVTAQPGAVYDFGFYSMTVLGPVKAYDDMNNNSVVVRVDCGETSFLLTGDIEEQAEHDLLSMGYDVECTVLKAPHHGSETSSSYVFLRAAYPEMVVIQCGRDNSYGHPHEDPLSRYRDAGATVYRTDTMGTIHMTSDGHSVATDAQGIASPVTRAPDGQDDLSGGSLTSVQAYIGNANSKKFHLPACSKLPAEQNRVPFDSRKEAIDAGYEPCGTCKP
jgi:competence protein ComEC